MGHTITAVREDGPAHWTVEYFDDTDTDRVRGYGLSIPREAVHNRMAAYGLATPREALDWILHEHHWMMVRPPDPRDDPALIEGWVTGTDPDAVVIELYAARSGADAAAAARVRVEACRSAAAIMDPGGLLPDPDPDPVAVRWHRELTDTARWVQVYGALPVPPLSRTRTPAVIGGPSA